MEQHTEKLITANKQKEQLDLFIWNFHDEVNERLKTSIMDWDTVYNLYSHYESSAGCKLCDEAHKN